MITNMQCVMFKIPTSANQRMSYQGYKRKKYTCHSMEIMILRRHDDF